MDCERYKSWITDAAAGALPPSRDRDLRAHLAQCDDCRRAFERERSLVVAIDETLGRALDVEPSPEMLARIRQKIAADAVDRIAWSFRPWWAAVAAAAMAAIVAGIWVGKLRRPSTTKPAVVASLESPHPARSASGLTERVRHPLPQGEGQREDWSVPPFPRGERVPDVGGRVRGSRLVAKNRRPRQSHEPDVLVEKDEAQLVLELYNGLVTGRINGASLAKVPPGFKQQPDGSLVPVPLKIEPITIAEIGAGRKDENVRQDAL